MFFKLPSYEPFFQFFMQREYTGCPNKHGNSETKLDIVFVKNSVMLPNFNGQNKFMSDILCKQ